VVATLENASERAAVLQAEGAYEAALAASEQSGVGLDEAATNLRRAQSTAITTFQSSYNTVNAAFRNDIDDFFANPNSFVPGVKIDGQGQTQFLNNERIAFRNILSDWLTETTAISPDADLSLALNNANLRIDRTIALVEVFITLFNAEDADRSYTEAELNTFSSDFTALRSTLQAAKIQVNNDLAALENAEDAVRRAEINASGSQSSAADAQVKQALGSLRAAQANLSKTILQTPISGTVNSLNVRVGDFVGSQDIVARVANNNALEVVTFVGDKEIGAFQTGTTVIIEDRFEGTVTEVAPAVDPVTRKTEVRIAIETEEIQNGDTVTITKDLTVESNPDQPVVVPLSAVKFEIDDGFIFVVTDGKLQSRPVELGVVRGGTVEVLSGLTNDEAFVVDARGLLEDTEVEVRQQ
jgi:RND family efflux transporter MFP subunit